MCANKSGWYLVSGKVGGDAAKAAAVEAEGHSHCALVASHTKHPTCHTGGAHATHVLLHAISAVKPVPEVTCTKRSDHDEAHWRCSHHPAPACEGRDPNQIQRYGALVGGGGGGGGV